MRRLDTKIQIQMIKHVDICNGNGVAGDRGDDGEPRRPHQVDHVLHLQQLQLQLHHDVLLGRARDHALHAR